MAILNEALLKLNLNKMKFYQKECLLNIESLNKNSNINNIYKSTNVNKINNFEVNLIKNLQMINRNFQNNVIVLEKNINKYQKQVKETESIFENIGDL